MFDGLDGWSRPAQHVWFDEILFSLRVWRGPEALLETRNVALAGQKSSLVPPSRRLGDRLRWCDRAAMLFAAWAGVGVALAPNSAPAPAKVHFFCDLCGLQLVVVGAARK